MPSFDIRYDARDDVLEVAFCEESRHSRTFKLSANVLATVDDRMMVIENLVLYDYSRLLRVGEVELNGLDDLGETECDLLLTLLMTWPVTCFLALVPSETPLARVKSPNVQDLVSEP